jgi:hypothetical protein
MNLLSLILVVLIIFILIIEYDKINQYKYFLILNKYKNDKYLNYLKKQKKIKYMNNLLMEEKNKILKNNNSILKPKTEYKNEIVKNKSEYKNEIVKKDLYNQTYSEDNYKYNIFDDMGSEGDNMLAHKQKHRGNMNRVAIDNFSRSQNKYSNINYFDQELKDAESSRWWDNDDLDDEF